MTIIFFFYFLSNTNLVKEPETGLLYISLEYHGQGASVSAPRGREDGPSWSSGRGVPLLEASVLSDRWSRADRAKCKICQNRRDSTACLPHTSGPSAFGYCLSCVYMYVVFD